MHAVYVPDAGIFNDVIDSAQLRSDAYLMLDADSGEGLYMNPSAAELLGVRPDRPPYLEALLPMLRVMSAEPDEAALRGLLGMAPRGPFYQCLLQWHERCGASDWLEWTSVWVDAPNCSRLLLRGRSVGLEELQDVAAAQLPRSDAEEVPSPLALLDTDASNAVSKLRFANTDFLHLFKLGPAQDLELTDLVAVGLPPLEALMCKAALLSRRASQFRVQMPNHRGEARAWLVKVTPQSLLEDELRAVGLMQMHPLASAGEKASREGKATRLDVVVSFECDSEGRLSEVGDGWAPMTGRQWKNSLNQPLAQMVHPDARAACERLLAPLLGGERDSARFEWPFLRGNSELRWLELRLWRKPAEPGRWQGSLSDITQRFNAQSLHAIRQAVNHMNDDPLKGLIICDYARPGIPAVYVDAAFTRLSSYSAEETLGRSPAFMQGELRSQPEAAIMREALRKGEAVTTTLKNVRRNGAAYLNHVELSPVREPHTGLITHYVGLVKDVSPTQSEAGEDRASEFEAIFQKAPLAKLVADAQGRITAANEALLDVLNLQKHEVEGRTLHEVLQLATERTQPERPLQNWPEVGRPALWFLTRPRRRVLEASCLSLQQADDAHSVMVLRDASQDSNATRTQNQLLLDAAHQLRSPMNSIRGFSELMLLHEFPRDEAKRMLETVSRQSVRLNELLSQLLDLAKIEGRSPKEPQAIEPQAAVQRAVAAAANPMEPRQVQCLWPAEPVRVWAEAGALEQALSQLIDNAFKFSPGGGEVSIEVLTQAPGHAGWVGFQVRDHGLGLDADQQAKLFTRFYRGHAKHNIAGAGLGLVIAKELVESLGGRMEVQSQPGQGTSITVWLRSAAEPAGVPH